MHESVSLFPSCKLDGKCVLVKPDENLIQEVMLAEVEIFIFNSSIDVICVITVPGVLGVDHKFLLGSWQKINVT